MLVGLIPLVLYVATTRIFTDEELELEEKFAGSVRFESDFGTPGRSKSDAIYGDDKESGILENRYLQLDEQFQISRLSIPFAEPLFCELPVDESQKSVITDIGGTSTATELSAEHSPNFSGKEKTRSTQNAKSGKANSGKGPHSKRKNGKRRKAS